MVVETCRACSSGSGPSEMTQSAKAATMAKSADAMTTAMRRRIPPPSSPGMTTVVAAAVRCSFRRTHLDRTGAAAAVARRVVHVLDIGLRQHVFARRHRTHDVGHGEHRLVVAGTIDRRGEAVVAKFGVFRLLA